MKKLISIFIVSLMFVGLAWAQSATILDNDCSTGADNTGWTFNDAGGNPIIQTATGGYWLLDDEGDNIISPSIDVTGYQNLTLTFTLATYGSGGNNPATVEYSVDGGTTWATDSFVSATPTSATYISSGTWSIGDFDTDEFQLRWSRPTDSGRGVRIKGILLKADPLGVSTPVLGVLPEAISNLNYFFEDGPSVAQNFVIVGTSIADDVIVTAPANFELSLTESGTYSSVLNIAPINDELDNVEVFVRLSEDLDVNAYSGIISIETDGADEKTVAVSGSVFHPMPDSGYYVDFEDESTDGYNDGLVTLNGMDWIMTQVLIGDLDADFKNGTQSARFRGYGDSSMVMDEDKANGLGTVSFFYRRYGTDSQVDWKVEYSTDQGDSWILIGDVFTAPATNDIQQFYGIVEQTGNVRIRIKRETESGGANRRLNIDDIFLSDFASDMPIVATPIFSIDGGFYTEAQTVSITTDTENATIRYTIDGSNPSEVDGEIYENPVVISENTTLKAIAYKADHANSSVATAVYSFPIVVENIAELRAGATGGTVYHLTGEAILTYQNANRNTKYIQDATAAIVIDDQPGAITTEYDLYDGITGILGTLGAYGGLLQFSPTADPGVATSSDNVVEPELFTIDQLTSDDQAKLVKVEGLTFVDASGVFPSTAQNIDAIDGDGTPIVIRTFIDTDYADTAIPTEAFDLIAVVGQYGSEMQLHPRFLADFTIVPDVPTYDHDKDDLVEIDDETLAEFDGEYFLGADDIEVLDPNDYTPFPNDDFTPTKRGKWMLYGTGDVTITVLTYNDWFAWVEGGAWNTVEGGNDHNIVVNLDAKDAVFEFMTGNGTNPTLPVELSYFNALYMVESGNVMLSWKTESETQMSGYRIYRSENNELENALLITPVMIEATNSSTGGKYSFADNELNEGTYYYWLEAVGYNSSEYYGYQSVVVENPAAPELPSISSMSNAYPNPFRSSTKVDIDVKAGETANFTVYNMLGQAVYTRTLPEGQTILEWNGLDKNGKRCGSGIYFYKLSSPSASQTKKVVLMK